MRIVALPVFDDRYAENRELLAVLVGVHVANGKAPICASVTTTFLNGFAGLFHVHPEDAHRPAHQ